MKLLVFMASLFYRWYNNQKSSKEIAYESAIMGMELFFFLNSLTIIAFLRAYDIISFEFASFTKKEGWMYVLFFGAIGYFLLSKLIPKKKLLALDIEKRDIDRDYFYLIAYWLVSLALFIIAIKIPLSVA